MDAVNALASNGGPNSRRTIARHRRGLSPAVSPSPSLTAATSRAIFVRLSPFFLVFDPSQAPVRGQEPFNPFIALGTPWQVKRLGCSGSRITGAPPAMLRWALIFFVLALFAALFGFGAIAVAFAGLAKILFFIFLALLVISLIAHVVRGRAPPA